VSDHYDGEEPLQSVDVHDFFPMVVGAAIGVIVIVGIVVFVVLLMKRMRSGNKKETEMAKVVHVPEASPASADGVETL